VKPLSTERAARLLRALRRQRVLVVGDVMLDEFLWGSASRLSPEAPVPVVRVTRQTFHLGGAGNVAANVRALGGQAVLVGVVGDDEAGRRLRAALAAPGVDDGLVTAADARPTTVKTRIIAQHQQVVRADREQADNVPAADERALLERLRALLPACGAVVVSDYQKGVVTRGLMKALVPLARRRGVPVLVDPKVRHFGLYRNATLVTPNQQEAEQATGHAIRDEASLRAAGQRILRQVGCEAVLITRGEHGLALFPRRGRPTLIPTAARQVFDVTGAGDTVIATLALGLGAGTGLVAAAVLANHAAGVVVGKLGTATASPDEVMAALAGAAG
jgi:rfaE bifunctional protein kinase chain/domain